MKFLSVCSGIEAASQAWQPLGWSAVAFSEIEPAPCAVLAHHYPDTPNWGDMTKYKDWPDEPIDLLCGGTPCQSFSVAGLRKGLDDPRGNLMLTFGAIAAKYRPKWLVWENVPGVLSSNGGADFGAFLGMLGELGYGFAYRVLDAQYFGVAQRRRRVFVVGCLGGWRSAAAVLFERHSLSGHPAPSRKAGQGTSRGVEFGPSGGRFTDVNPTLDTRAKDWPIRNQLAGAVVSWCSRETADTLVKGANQTTGFYSPEIVATLCVATGQAGAEIGADMAPTLNCNHEAPYVVYPDVYTLQHAQIGRKDSAGPQGKGWQEGVAFTQDSRSCADVVAFDTTQITSTANYSNPKAGDPCHPLAAQAHVPTIAWMEELTASVDCAGTMQRGGAGGRHDGVMTQTMQIRRLTPVECARLQGFPDHYLDTPLHRGKPLADGPKYRALGNSWAVPVVSWIGERIAQVHNIHSSHQKPEDQISESCKPPSQVSDELAHALLGN